ncbi:MAG TPA: choice-of-anchor V domain-containing protein [Balneolaceae bacterium]
MIRIFCLPLVTLLLGFSLNLTPKQPLKPTAYPEHLTGAFTGGFGEETCRSCHFDYDLNPEGGSLSVSGIGEEISPGEILNIQITVRRNDLGKAGFQLSARFTDGSQAGRFKIKDNERVMFTEAVPDSLQYIQHSEAGTKPVKSGVNSWTVAWQAPESIEKAIIFNVAANAANGDASEFGDFIYAEEIRVNRK